jgi:hypothetical protein
MEATGGFIKSLLWCNTDFQEALEKAFRGFLLGFNTYSLKQEGLDKSEKHLVRGKTKLVK